MSHDIQPLRSWIGVLAPPVNAPITHDHGHETQRIKARDEHFARAAFRHLFGREVLHIEEAKEKQP